MLINQNNQVVKTRAFSADPQVVSRMANSYAKGLMDERVLSTYKHFPGHGNTSEDTHLGYAYSDKTLEELHEAELIPFIEGIKNGIPLIMTAHISLPQINGDETPASLSKKIVTELLRDALGFTGIIITDALNMGAISDHYSSSEAAIKAIEAGNDMILMPANLYEAYSGVLSAVKEGYITEERIDDSLFRIIKAKLLLESSN